MEHAHLTDQTIQPNQKHRLSKKFTLNQQQLNAIESWCQMLALLAPQAKANVQSDHQ